MSGSGWRRLAAVGALAAIAGFGFHLWRQDQAGGGPQPDAAAIFAARLPDLQGKEQALEQWRGRVLVVNFWATWCTPCREEIPEFVKLQERHGAGGLQFVGIALDQPGPVAAFAREFRMNYPVLLGGLESMDLMRRTGNRAGALPFTLVINREGAIVSREFGGVREAKLEKTIKPLL